MINEIKNFGNAMSKYVQSGFAHVSLEERERRRVICESCPFFDAGRCKICGCFLRLKTVIATESCPDNPPRWGAVEVTENLMPTNPNEIKDCGCNQNSSEKT